MRIETSNLTAKIDFHILNNNVVDSSFQTRHVERHCLPSRVVAVVADRNNINTTTKNNTTTTTTTTTTITNGVAVEELVSYFEGMMANDGGPLLQVLPAEMLRQQVSKDFSSLQNSKFFDNYGHYCSLCPISQCTLSAQY